MGRAAGAAMALVPLAGCTEDVGEDLPPNEHWPVAGVFPELPIERRSDVLAARIEEMATRGIADLDGFERELSDADVSFATVELTDVRLELEYVNTTENRRVLIDVIGLTAGGFAALVEAGVDVRSLELVVYVPERPTVGVVEAAHEWAVRFNASDLSGKEFGELVVSTIESRRRPPVLDVAPDE